MIKDLNKKRVLDKQGMSFPITSIAQGKILLLWNHNVDF